MRKSAALLALVPLLLPASGRAAEPFVLDAYSDVCTLVATTDVTFPTVRTGRLGGGPLTGVDGRLKCTVQVGYPTHAGVDAASTAGSGTDVVVVKPAIVSYVAPAGVSVYLCAEFIPWGSPTKYWDPTGFWSDSDRTPCGYVTSAGTNDPIFDSLRDLASLVDETKKPIDPPVCTGVLAPLHPAFPDPSGPVYVAASGDTYVAGERLWNCPPY
jgi:hypothetical protein